MIFISELFFREQQGREARRRTKIPAVKTVIPLWSHNPNDTHQGAFTATEYLRNHYSFSTSLHHGDNLNEGSHSYARDTRRLQTIHRPENVIPFENLVEELLRDKVINDGMGGQLQRNKKDQRKHSIHA